MIFQTFAKISGTTTASGEVTVDNEQFHAFFDVVAKRTDIKEIYDRWVASVLIWIAITDSVSNETI